MKKLILALAMGMACVSGFAQGSMEFGSGNGCVFYVSDSNGARVGGSAYAADLYWGLGTITDSSTLTAFGSPVNFSSNAAQAGLFLGVARQFATVAGGGTITVQVRAWNTADGSSYTQVLNSGSLTAQVGASILTQVTLTVPPTTPPFAVGMNGQNFSLHAVPEPGTLALAGLGAAAMFIFRRRR